MVKVDGTWQEKYLHKPQAMDCSNQHMGGVDVFNQLASGNRLLRRSKKFTKVLFYDMLEISVINSFTLMQEWRTANPGVIRRRKRYAQSSFRENLVRQLANIPLKQNPP